MVSPMGSISILKTGAKIIHKCYFAMAKIITPFFSGFVSKDILPR